MLKHRITRSLISLPLLITAHVTSAAELPQAIDAAFQSAVSAKTVPGITVAVADKSGVIAAKGYGFADIENQVLMSPEHKVRIGSVSKLIATAAMMRLYDKGLINLDKPVTDYVTNWPEKHATLTLRQLASHTAGIRHYKKGANEFLLNKWYGDIDSALAMFKDDPLLFEPGTKQQYSTFAWTLVSAAMEGADPKRNFREVIEQEVFSPLKLNDTYFDEQFTLIPHRARPYSVDQGRLINSPQTDHSYKWAGGGFIATPSDIVKFAVAHTQGNYLKASTVDEMFTPATLNNGEQVNFGIGWMTGFKNYQQREKYQHNTELQALMADMPHAVMHSGGSMGGITMTIMCVDHQRAVTVVKNVNGDNSADVFALALQTLSYYHQDH